MILQLGHQPKGERTYYLAIFQKLLENEENLAGTRTCASKNLLQRELCSLSISVSLILLGLFGCVTCVEYDQSQSDLPAVPGDIPDGATQVVLRGNEIRALGDGNFSALTYCTNLDLGENPISVIQPGSFRGLPRLFTLELDINELTEVKRYIFQNLTQLTYLLLQSNLIKFIQDDSFKSLVNLEQLHLVWNVLDELRAAMFNGRRSIKLINLDGNKLTSIDSSTFSDLPPGADPGFGQGGAQLLRPKVADIAKQSRASEASILWAGSFWVFDAQICILTHSRDSFSLIFDIYFDTKS